MLAQVSQYCNRDLNSRDCETVQAGSARDARQPLKTPLRQGRDRPVRCPHPSSERRRPWPRAAFLHWQRCAVTVRHRPAGPTFRSSTACSAVPVPVAARCPRAGPLSACPVVFPPQGRALRGGSAGPVAVHTVCSDMHRIVQETPGAARPPPHESCVLRQGQGCPPTPCSTTPLVSLPPRVLKATAVGGTTRVARRMPHLQRRIRVARERGGSRGVLQIRVSFNSTSEHLPRLRRGPARNASLVAVETRRMCPAYEQQELDAQQGMCCTVCWCRVHEAPRVHVHAGGAARPRLPSRLLQGRPSTRTRRVEAARQRGLLRVPRRVLSLPSVLSRVLSRVLSLSRAPRPLARPRGPTAPRLARQAPRGAWDQVHGYMGASRCMGGTGLSLVRSIHTKSPPARRGISHRRPSTDRALGLCDPS